MKVTLNVDMDTVNIVTQDDKPVVTLFFHRLRGGVSNTTIVLHPHATIQDVAPTVIYEAPPKPALIRRT